MLLKEESYACTEDTKSAAASLGITGQEEIVLTGRRQLPADHAMALPVRRALTRQNGLSPQPSATVERATFDVALQGLEALYTGRVRSHSGVMSVSQPANSAPDLEGKLLQKLQQDPYFSLAGILNPDECDGEHHIAGHAVTFQVLEATAGSSDGMRECVIVVGGLTGGQANATTAAARGASNLGRSVQQLGDIARLALGRDTEQQRFGRLVGEMAAELQTYGHNGKNVRVSIIGHSLGAAAAREAQKSAIHNEQPIKAMYANPAPLPKIDRAELAEWNKCGLSVKQFSSAFVAPYDPVNVAPNLWGVRSVLRALGGNQPLVDIAEVYEWGDPALSGLEQHNDPAANLRAAFVQIDPTTGGIRGEALLHQFSIANQQSSRFLGK